MRHWEVRQKKKRAMGALVSQLCPRWSTGFQFLQGLSKGRIPLRVRVGLSIPLTHLSLLEGHCQEVKFLALQTCHSWRQNILRQEMQGTTCADEVHLWHLLSRDLCYWPWGYGWALGTASMQVK